MRFLCLATGLRKNAATDNYLAVVRCAAFIFKRPTVTAIPIGILAVTFADFLKKFYAVLPSAISTKLQGLYNSWVAKRLDGKVTIREFLDFIDEALTEVMALIDSLAADGKVKKAIVLEFAGLLFDAFAPVIIGRWSWLGWLIYLLGGQDFAREAFLDLASILIEAIFQAKFATRPIPLI